MRGLLTFFSAAHYPISKVISQPRLTPMPKHPQPSNEAMQLTRGPLCFPAEGSYDLQLAATRVDSSLRSSPPGFVYVTAWQSIPSSPAVADLVSR